MTAYDDPLFNQLLDDAVNVEFSGWDFRRFGGRWHEADPTWNYLALVRAEVANATALLDMDTGGGEFLESLAPLPPFTAATENYPPNIPLAQARLSRLGVDVLSPADDEPSPFADGTFDLIHNRHGAFRGIELARLLMPGGRFITQQVGGANCMRLNQALDAPAMTYDDHTLARTVAELEAAGLRIDRAEEEFPDSVFADIGIVVIYLRIIPWQIPDFDVARYRPQLYRLHEEIRRNGGFNARGHRFLVQAHKPPRPKIN